MENVDEGRPQGSIQHSSAKKLRLQCSPIFHETIQIQFKALVEKTFEWSGLFKSHLLFDSYIIVFKCK